MGNKELDKMYLNNLEPCEDPGNNDHACEEPERRRKAKRKPKALLGFLAGIIAGCLICVATFYAASLKSQATTYRADYTEKIDTIIAYLDLYYLEELTDEDIETALAKGLMSNIGDKYAEYYTAEEFSELMEQMSGEYAGIGVQIVMNDDNNVEVYKVFSDSPAEEAGVKIKDLIVEAAGLREFETLDDLVAVVRGEEGTAVDIVVLRNGEEIPMTIERRRIETESVYSDMLTGSVGYMQITEFNTATISQFEDGISRMEEEGMESLIIDLRGNPGGDYDAIVAICDRVLPEGVIVSVEDNLGGIYTENSDALSLDIPIILVIDENTASAAELFTMALHDYGIAQTVGTVTYGKGIVQSIFRLLDGSGLKFTTEKYYGPKGNYIQDSGIEPDFLVELPEEAYEDGVVTIEEDVQLQKAAELLGIDAETFIEAFYAMAGADETEEPAE